jgi:DNA-directed RNA polymerase specialized sigma24 family protein
MPSGESRADVWELVRLHQHDLERAVEVGVKRGVVAPQDREDALADAQILAVELAERYDPTKGNFTHYLRTTLAKRFRFDGRDTEWGEVSIDAGDGEGGSPVEDLPAPEDTLSAETTNPILAEYEELMNQIGVMPRRERRLAMGYFLHGLSARQLVKKYRVSLATVVTVTKKIKSPRLHIGKVLRSTIDTDELLQRIGNLPHHVQPIARGYLLEDLSPTILERSTTRQDILRILTEMWNTWK